MFKRALSLHTAFRQLPRGQFKVVRLFSNQKDGKELTTEQVIEMEPVYLVINIF